VGGSHLDLVTIGLHDERLADVLATHGRQPTIGASVARFPSMRGREMFALLQRSPLVYRVASPQKGSHVKLESDAGYPPLLLAFHGRDEIPPGLVRKVLMRDVGLTEEEALALL
jgi:predicted RNA binding protein YcfA (HicA-like mRNA interferase family)